MTNTTSPQPEGKERKDVRLHPDQFTINHNGAIVINTEELAQALQQDQAAQMMSGISWGGRFPETPESTAPSGPTGGGSHVPKAPEPTAPVRSA